LRLISESRLVAELECMSGAVHHARPGTTPVLNRGRCQRSAKQAIAIRSRSSTHMSHRAGVGWSLEEPGFVFGERHSGSSPVDMPSDEPHEPSPGLAAGGILLATPQTSSHHVLAQFQLEPSTLPYAHVLADPRSRLRGLRTCYTPPSLYLGVQPLWSAANTSRHWRISYATHRAYRAPWRGQNNSP
jgi:hypothetical protein